MIPITPKIRNLVFSANLYRLISLRNLSHIVTYHMISDSLNGFYPETATKVFERQIAHLSKNYEIIPLDEVSLRITTGRSLRRSVAITFDDGFRDNYEKAYPILKRYNAPATIFVAAGYIESGDIPWFIRLRYIFKNTDRTRFQLRAIGSDGVMPMTSRSERFAASQVAMEYLMLLPERDRASLIRDLADDLKVAGFDELGNLMLDWRQIREMSENGISMGAHTVTHPNLNSVPLGKAEWEIRTSKETIEQNIRSPVTSFAYPFGRLQQFSRQHVDLLKALQFKCAVTTELGVVSHKSNVFELHRSAPWDFHMAGSL